jgi:hypothetical protein
LLLWHIGRGNNHRVTAIARLLKGLNARGAHTLGLFVAKVVERHLVGAAVIAEDVTAVAAVVLALRDREGGVAGLALRTLVVAHPFRASAALALGTLTEPESKKRW